MNEAVRRIKSGFPGETFREVITKAVCGKAQKPLKSTSYIDPPEGVVPNQILGCSVTEMRLNEPEVKDTSTNIITIVAGGIFEIHIWYAYRNGKETNVLRYPVKFEESLSLENYDCQDVSTVDARVTVNKCPVVVESAITEDNRIKLETEMEIAAEVVGETKLFVQVYDPGRAIDDGEDDD